MRVRAVTGGLVCSLLALAVVGAESAAEGGGDARQARRGVPVQFSAQSVGREPAATPPAPAGSAPRPRWAESETQGQAGAVSPPVVQVTDLGDVAGVIIPGLTALRFITETGPIAYRSPAFSGAQEVHAMYLLEQWSGSGWVIVVRSDVLVGVIGAAQNGVIFGRADLRPTVARGYWRVTWLFGWYSSTALVASALVTPDSTGDHVCVTTARRCETGPGWVETGGYLDNT